MKRSVVRTVWIAVVLFFPVLPVVAFYWTMMSRAHQEVLRIGLPGAARNGIQHAYAAAETYSRLRQFGLDSAEAQRATIRLGYLNEWAEAYFKWPRDTTREVYKDLRNNYLGVVAMRLTEHCRSARTPTGRLAIVGGLAAERVILWRSDDARVPDLSQPIDVARAIAAFEADVAAIERSADKARPDCSDA